MLKEYFEKGSGWHYDKYEAQKVSAKRWRLAFIIQAVASILLTICLISLFPLKSIIPMPIYINQELGTVRVDRPTPFFKPETEAMIKSDIVRYIRNREGYFFYELNHRIRQTWYLSSNEVYQDYISKFNAKKNSIQEQLGPEGKISVQVNNVVFLDSKNNTPVINDLDVSLAKVDFTKNVIKNGIAEPEYWTATLSFEYRGVSKEEEEIWENWNGFKVLSYRLDKRIL